MEQNISGGWVFYNVNFYVIKLFLFWNFSNCEKLHQFSLFLGL